MTGSSAHPPIRPADLAPPERGPFTLERLRDLWPRIIADAETRSRMLGQALRASDVVSVAPPVIKVELRERSAVYEEGLARQRATIEQVVAAYVEGAVRVEIVKGRGSGAGSGAGARAGRLSEGDAKAERLKVLEAKDPSLRAAVEALDLELLE